MRSGLFKRWFSPVTCAIFVSCPSIIKLFDRSRMPLTEKTTVASGMIMVFWLARRGLTPAAYNASFATLWLGLRGNSEILRASKFTPTSPLAVFNSGASATTVTFSVLPETLNLTERSAS